VNNMGLVMYGNIQGYLQKKDEITFILNLHKPTLFCLTETHITDSISQNEIEIENYEVIICLSHSSHTGGCLIYIRKPIKYKSLQNIVFNNNTWIASCTLLVPGSHLEMYVLYRSPSSNNTEFINFL
jgi:exonuclease III